jgi:hypothetical protein
VYQFGMVLFVAEFDQFASMRALRGMGVLGVVHMPVAAFARRSPRPTGILMAPGSDCQRQKQSANDRHPWQFRHLVLLS